jgi:hypothetical protein
LTARRASRNVAGASQTSVPLPTIKVSMPAAAAKTRSSEARSICCGWATGHAQIASGRHNNEPRCDISAK